MIKPILDACCDSRMFHFDKQNPHVLFADNRTLETTMKDGDSAWLVKKYGRLNPDWRTQLKQGFDECMRVLDDFSTLIFKWNETQIPVSKIIKTVGYQPIIGHKSGKAAKTHWLLFMKITQPSES